MGMLVNDHDQKNPVTKTVWAIAISVGAAAWIAVGWLFTDGGGKIAAIFGSTFVLITALRWRLRRKRWFYPLLFAWIVVHVMLLSDWILPMELRHSKAFLPLFTVDGFSLYGLISFANRLWVEPPDDTRTVRDGDVC